MRYGEELIHTYLFIYLFNYGLYNSYCHMDMQNKINEINNNKINVFIYKGLLI